MQDLTTTSRAALLIPLVVLAGCDRDPRGVELIPRLAAHDRLVEQLAQALMSVLVTGAAGIGRPGGEPLRGHAGPGARRPPGPWAFDPLTGAGGPAGAPGPFPAEPPVRPHRGTARRRRPQPPDARGGGGNAPPLSAQGLPPDRRAVTASVRHDATDRESPSPPPGHRPHRRRDCRRIAGILRQRNPGRVDLAVEDRFLVGMGSGHQLPVRPDDRGPPRRVPSSPGGRSAPSGRSHADRSATGR